MGLASGGVGITALVGGNTLEENLSRLVEKFPVSESGYFGKRGHGKHYIRNIESNNPARTAAEFAQLASMYPSSVSVIKGKGMVYTLRDGGVVSYRYFSSSDGTPVVELTTNGISGIKNQKIHFVLKRK